jgi:3-isopropylmalate dehydratase/3-isopropylmalate/(R)-2-methylmalate dehydratase small subunit
MSPRLALGDFNYSPAGVLVTGDNFGCGSSREHAPWALMDFGITCVIASSFADIFYNNCFQNGLLPVVLKPDEVQALTGECLGGNHMVSVDLEAQTVTSPSGRIFAFEIDASRKAKMLNGLDAIGETLSAAADIDAWEAGRTLTHPWLERA